AVHRTCPLCANSGLMQCSKRHLLDHLVGSSNQGRWYGEAERRMSALVIGNVYFTPKSGHLSVV
ncbi:MAG: hypothetical protein WCA25_20430, partial [Pseudolabrys sp.]